MNCHQAGTRYTLCRSLTVPTQMEVDQFMNNIEISDSVFERTASRVSLVSMFVNLFLTVFKFIAGILGHSGAMVSDALHSLTDVAGSLIVLVGVRLSGRQSDEGHPYGHERIECIASIILSGILLAAGASIGLGGLKQILAIGESTPTLPGRIALIAAIVSIVVKETLFWYTYNNAKRINSGALKAEAWHHRSDALSSIGALIGIAGARAGFPVLEPIASLLICVLIIKAAVEIFIDAVNKLVDHSCSADLEHEIRSCVEQQNGVLRVDLLQTREFGRKVYVDLEIGMDKDLPLDKAHSTAEAVHDAIEQRFSQVKHVMIHVNPV